MLTGAPGITSFVLGGIALHEFVLCIRTLYSVGVVLSYCCVYGVLALVVWCGCGLPSLHSNYLCGPATVQSIVQSIAQKTVNRGLE